MSVVVKTLATKKIMLYLVLLTGSFFISFIAIFEHWVWSPWWSFVIFCMVFFMDWITAIRVSFKRGGTFNTEKTIDFFGRLVFSALLLCIVHNAPKLNSALGVTDERMRMILELAPSGLYLSLFFTTLISAVKNAVIVGWVKGRTAKWIYKNFDSHKNNENDNIL